MKQKKSLFLLLILWSSSLFAQEKYPQNYFRNPLDIPMNLAGTFGELRTDHFHSGMDLKTNQKEGLKVHTAASGYISRIKVANWGYGKALYITHPNGYTSVYAHLKNFSPKIEAYVKNAQYRKELNEIQLFPKEGELPISKDEVIALSGSTGGFIAPHLHFEIRNTKSEKIINPMHFGLRVQDTKKPIINHLRGYVFNNYSHINSNNEAIPITFKKMKDGTYKASDIIAYGKIAFAINTYDQQDGGNNKNGIYKMTLIVNGNKRFEHKVETFAFDESKYINLLIDYPFYANHRRQYQQTFIHPRSQLSTYSTKAGKGYLYIENNKNYQVSIVVEDFEGNKSSLNIAIAGKLMEPKVYANPILHNHQIKHDSIYKVDFNGTGVSFLKNTFYDNHKLNITFTDSILNIHKAEFPVHRNFIVTFNTANYTKQAREKMYIARIQKGAKYYCQTRKEGVVFKTTTRTLGSYTLDRDTIIPQIDRCSFYKNQVLNNNGKISIRIQDAESGLQNYRGEIDGKWIRMEMNVKNNFVTFDMKDKDFAKGKHTFKIIVMDNVGNTRTFTSLFQIK